MSILAVARRVVPLLVKGTRLALQLSWDAPWWAFLAGLSLVRASLAVLRFIRVLVETSRDIAPCPRCGHGEALLGTWRCPVCKAVQATHAWSGCTICGTAIPAGYIACGASNCGEAIRNPKLRRLW